MQNELSQYCSNSRKTCSVQQNEGTFTCTNGANCTLLAPNSNVRMKFDNFSQHILDVNSYKNIQLLRCAPNRKGKFRFGKKRTFTFPVVYVYFRDNVITQYCQCYWCNCSCSNNDDCFSFFCNCKFTDDSVPVTTPPTVMTYAPNISTSVTTSAYVSPQIPEVTEHSTSPFTETTEPVTSPLAHTTEPVTSPLAHTSEPVTSPLADTTQPVTSPYSGTTEHVTSQLAEKGATTKEMDSSSIVAAMVTAVVLTLVVVCVTVFVCIRRRKRMMKDDNQPVIKGTSHSYEHLQVNRLAGFNNLSYCEVEGERDMHTYDTLDRPSESTDTGKEYSYAEFNTNHVTQGYTHEGSDLAGDSTALPNGDNYFLVETNGVIHRDEHGKVQFATGNHVSDADNYFTLEVSENQENERNESNVTDDKSCIPPEDNYFLLSKNPAEQHPDYELASSGQGQWETTDHTTDNYFILENSNIHEVRNADNSIYELANALPMQEVPAQKDTGQKVQGMKRPEIVAGKRDDSYDHVRIGGSLSNGVNDDVYDELRGQNVRSLSGDVDNDDYDHC